MALGLFPRPFLVILAGSRSKRGDSAGNGSTFIAIGLLVTATYRIVDREAGQIRIDFAFVDAVGREFRFSTSKLDQKKKN